MADVSPEEPLIIEEKARRVESGGTWSTMGTLVGVQSTWVRDVMSRWVIRGVAGGRDAGRGVVWCTTALPGDGK